jgi:CHAT domain-containing protein
VRGDSSELERALLATSDPALLARVSNDLGNAAQLAGEREAALRAYGEAERLARSAGEPLTALLARANRAVLLLGSGRDERAPADRAALQRELAAQSGQDHDAAFAELQLALADVETENGADPAWLREIADAAARRGDARAGSFARALEAAQLARAGSSEQSIEAARGALLLAQRARAPEAELFAGRLLGRELERQGSHAAAVRALEAAHAIRARYFAAISDAQTAPAPYASWLAAAPLLDELVDALLRLAAVTEDPAERERRLLEARDHLDDATALALRDYFADQCVAAQRVVSAASLPGAVVVYPALLRDRVELIVSGPRGTRSVLVGAAPEEIVREARRLTELAQERTTRRYRAPAARLYDWLVRPLEEDLGTDGERTLVVVPRGALLRVPWAALWDAQRRVHLVQRHPLAIVPGLSLAESHPLSRDVHALKAGVSAGVQGLPALPAVPRELGEVASIYNGPTLLDAGFSAARLEAALRSEPYGVVHIASHASFGATADDAYVVTWDGRLGARQLADLVELTRYRDRPLEMLALSACDTSVGDERAALGLAGLAVRAGARSTLGTLWPVDDEAAAELVGRFYRELARPGSSRARALQRAQQAALAEPGLDHPAYWSPFVMIGSWQ